MARPTLPPLSFRAQFPFAKNLDIPTRGHSLYLAIIQQPLRKWEKPWRHQRAIVLFANSPEETKLRIQLEDRIMSGEQVLQIIRVGESQ